MPSLRLRIDHQSIELLLLHPKSSFPTASHPTQHKHFERTEHASNHANGSSWSCSRCGRNRQTTCTLVPPLSPKGVGGGCESAAIAVSDLAPLRTEIALPSVFVYMWMRCVVIHWAVDMGIGRMTL